MAKLPAPQLAKAVADAIEESNASSVLLSALTQNPRRFLVQLEQRSFELWVYVWTLTHGGGWARPTDEYRIQMTGVSPPLPLNPQGPTVLVGYEPNLKCFAGFDLNRHKMFSIGSPSIQININALHKALQDGLSFFRKGNNEIAIGIRPDQFLGYCFNAPDLHLRGADARMIGLLTQAASLKKIPIEEIESLSKERQRIVDTVSRLSRDSDFRRKVTVAYDKRCAVTRMQLRLIDAAHILPVEAEGGNDEVTNGICLSPTYHRAYDRRLIYLDESLVMRINMEQEKEIATLGLDGGLSQFKSYLGKAIHLPPDKRQWPAASMIRKANKFRRIPT